MLYKASSKCSHWQGIKVIEEDIEESPVDKT